MARVNSSIQDNQRPSEYACSLHWSLISEIVILESLVASPYQFADISAVAGHFKVLLVLYLSDKTVGARHIHEGLNNNQPTRSHVIMTYTYGFIV